MEHLIGYATRYLFANRYHVAAIDVARPSFSQKNNAYFYAKFLFVFFFQLHLLGF